jgi:hypothetical protein
MTPLRTIALATAVALPLGVLISQVVPRWGVGTGPEVECNSFVVDDLMRTSDLLRHSGDRIPPNQLHEELVKRGVTLPSPPSLTFAPRYYGRGAEALLREYESAKKGYEAKWEDIKGSPEYQRAREAILSTKRDETLRACLRIFGGKRV